MVFEAYLADEAETISIASKLSHLLQGKGLVFLAGQLGSGKTTFSRGLIRAMGHTGAVKSPTFTICEPYELDQGQVYHFDLYRLNDPEELEYMGMDDYLESGQLCLIEWPERGAHFLPECDVLVKLEVQGRGRRVFIEGKTQRGLAICEELLANN